MTAEPRRPSPGGEGDSWEALAQDLFGIEFSDVPSGEEILLPDEPALPTKSETAAAEASDPAADEGISAAKETPADLEWDDDDVEVAAESEAVIETDAEVEALGEGEPAAKSPPADDRYWDALN